MTDDDRLEMDPTETSKRLARLQAAGEDLQTAWQRIRGQIENPGKVNLGPLGAQFMSKYPDVKDAYFKVMDGNGTSDSPAFGEKYRQWAEFGDQCVTLYRETEERAAEEYGR
ncbi:hypothetical protein FPZ12_014320 [Amycolatopsis acidicola]|uniref:Uncharacterized protein n=1 Tax=Amycolatopsis acidicola TaxID=2596893 RepID=A0A5N0V8I9_9PSEU|nr:hypothetical protein [Amycolatopsis acidicola]KAA9161321.1 hypothetical protein FPZ12_014320 [Amycolatopsis acidicola]